jgi:hypothetical protein
MKIHHRGVFRISLVEPAQVESTVFQLKDVTGGVEQLQIYYRLDALAI